RERRSRTAAAPGARRRSASSFARVLVARAVAVDAPEVHLAVGADGGGDGLPVTLVELDLGAAVGLRDHDDGRTGRRGLRTLRRNDRRGREATGLRIDVRPHAALRG